MQYFGLILNWKERISQKCKYTVSIEIGSFDTKSSYI